jgi:hypothetical protein
MSRRLSASAVPVKAAAPEQKDQHNDYEDRIHDFFPSFLRYTKHEPCRSHNRIEQAALAVVAAIVGAAGIQQTAKRGRSGPYLTRRSLAGPSHVRAARLALAMNDKHSFLPVSRR